MRAVDNDSTDPDRSLGTVKDYIARLRAGEEHPFFATLMTQLLGEGLPEGGAERLVDPPSIRSLVKRRLWLERARLIWGNGA